MKLQTKGQRAEKTPHIFLQQLSCREIRNPAHAQTSFFVFPELERRVGGKQGVKEYLYIMFLILLSTTPYNEVFFIVVVVFLYLENRIVNSLRKMSDDDDS